MKIVEKKSRNYLEVAWKSPYLCTRFERETPLESDKNRFWKILEKVPKSFGDSEKWLTFAPASNATHGLKRYEKSSEKILKNSFKKIWWFENKHLSLHRFPLKNRGQNSGRGRKADPGEIKEIVLIVIYWTAFFEVFEQLKVFSTLAREWFQTIPLRLELKIYNKTFFTMESLILAQDER